MNASKDHTTAFKASRLAQILMAPTVALVTMDMWATGRHFASLKVGSLVLKMEGWCGAIVYRQRFLTNSQFSSTNLSAPVYTRYKTLARKSCLGWESLGDRLSRLAVYNGPIFLARLSVLKRAAYSMNIYHAEQYVNTSVLQTRKWLEKHSQVKYMLFNILNTKLTKKKERLKPWFKISHKCVSYDLNANSVCVYRISSNIIAGGDYFYFRTLRGRLFEGAIVSHIAHWESCPKYFVLYSH